jgi:hypothetical protein
MSDETNCAAAAGSQAQPDGPRPVERPDPLSGAASPLPLAQYGDRGVPILARYPQDWPDESKRGFLVTRKKPCPGFEGEKCQNTVEQMGISRAWLAKLTDGERSFFLKACEVETKTGNAYLPPRCARCERRLAA